MVTVASLDLGTLSGDTDAGEVVRMRVGMVRLWYKMHLTRDDGVSDISISMKTAAIVLGTQQTQHLHIIALIVNNQFIGTTITIKSNQIIKFETFRASCINKKSSEP